MSLGHLLLSARWGRFSFGLFGGAFLAAALLAILGAIVVARYPGSLHAKTYFCPPDIATTLLGKKLHAIRIR